MQIEAPFVYRPRLALAVHSRFSNEAVQLADSFVVHVDEVDPSDAPEELRWKDVSGAATTLRRYDGGLYEPLVVDDRPGPVSHLELQNLVESGYVPARDTLAGRDLITWAIDLDVAAGWERSLSAIPGAVMDRGDYGRQQSIAASRWGHLGLISIDGHVWQRADEPVLLLQIEGKRTRTVAAYPDSQIARTTSSQNIFPVRRAGELVERNFSTESPVEVIHNTPSPSLGGI